MKYLILLIFLTSAMTSSASTLAESECFVMGDIICHPEFNESHLTGRMSDKDVNPWFNDSRALWEFPIHWEVDNSVPSTQRDLIKQALESLTQGTCIKWVFGRDPNKGYIKFIAGSLAYCYAVTLGYYGKRAHNVRMGRDCKYEHHIIHPVMHILGFHHEHNRFDRDDYVYIDYENVKIQNQVNFQKLHTNLYEYQKYFYDSESMLHQDVNQYAKDARFPTIVPLHHSIDPVAFGFRNRGEPDRVFQSGSKQIQLHKVGYSFGLSVSDRQKLNEMSCIKAKGS